MKRMTTAFHAAPLAGLALRCQPDARLVALCREGHERAFEEIVRRYRQSLVRFAAAIVPAHRAEDVVQEALTNAHSSLVATDAEIRLKPWLYTIARNRALNDLRNEPSHQHLDDDFDGVPQPPEVAAQRSELAAVLAGVKSLPPGQREALLQRELEGRSHEEIAVAIGVTPGAARGLIFRARCTLRDAAGVLIPLPAMRALLNAGPLTSEATGAGVGGAAAGLTAGGGGGIAIKAGAAVLAVGLAVGSGVALHDRGDKRDAAAATIAGRGGSGITGSQTDPRSAAASGSEQGGPSEERHSGRGPGSSANSSGRGDGSGSSSGGPGSPGSERGSTAGHDGGEDGGHHSGGDDGPSDPTGAGGHEGPDDSPHVGDETGSEHEGGGTSSGDSGDTESSHDGGTTGGDGGGSEQEGTGSHEGADHPASDSETSPEH